LSPSERPPAAPGAARAKVNLYLRILGRRDDGYHRLDSLVAFADLADRLSAEPAASLSLSVDGTYAGQCGAQADNLVWRAAQLLADHARIPPAVKLSLTKNIPVAAGLGGGSADAAAALRLLAANWGVPLDRPELYALALRLGADVPVCLAGRASLIGGIGEELRPAPALPRAGLVLANPGQALATAAVFASLGGKFQPATEKLSAMPDAAALAAQMRARGNGLTEAALRLCPAIGAVLAQLRALPGALMAQMSGSGASCFALFADAAAARQAAAALSARHPGWFVHGGELIG